MDQSVPSEPPARRRPALWRRRAVRRAALVGLLAAVAVAAIGLCAALLVPIPDVSGPVGPPARVLLTADGQPFAQRGDYKEPPVQVLELPPHVVSAVLAAEDRRFYRHFGLDAVGVARAAVADARAGEVVQGGSTITQQLAKTMLDDRRRTLGRKAKEAALALALELRLSKDEILSRYLSSVYFGDGVYGLRAAARRYFGKPPQELTVGEAAMLAGVINAPSRLAPSRHPEAAREKARAVLAAMVDAGYLSPDAAAKAALPKVRSRRMADIGGYFADWALARAPAGRPGFGEEQIRTTLDAKLQRRAEQVVAAALKRAKGQHVSQAALVAMRTDGSVVAMVGGRDYGQSQFNRAVQAQRQPGSAFKLFVYLAALRQGASPYSLVPDEPIQIGDWAPRNADGHAGGMVTLEHAFATSSNLAAVQLSERVGRDAVIRAANDLGVTSELKPVPSLPLGSNPVNLLELTRAYAGVAAGAYPVIPAAFADQAGQGGDRSLAEQDDLMQLLGSTVAYGTAQRAAFWRPSFGKTGTTQDNRDAWFIGFADDLVVGVWVGNDDNSPMKAVSGGGLPAEIWKAFMQTALPEPLYWQEPPQVVEPEPELAPLPWLRRLGRLFGI